MADRRRRRPALGPGHPAGGPAPRRRLARHAHRRDQLHGAERRRRPAPTRARQPRRAARRRAGRRGAQQRRPGTVRGSADTALAWVQAMAEGDFQTAYDLSCADVQQSATDAAAGEDPAGRSARTSSSRRSAAGDSPTAPSTASSTARRRQRRRVVHAAAGRRRGVPAAGLRAVRPDGLRLPLSRRPSSGGARRAVGFRQAAQVPKISRVWLTSAKPWSPAIRSAHCSTAGPATSTVSPQTRQTRWWWCWGLQRR